MYNYLFCDAQIEQYQLLGDKWCRCWFIVRYAPPFLLEQIYN